MAFYGIASLVAELKTELQGSGASVSDDKGARYQQSSPPRIVWEYGRVQASDRRAARADMLQEDAHSATVHIWAATRADAEQLRLGVISALRKILKGRNYADDGAEWPEQTEQEITTLGFKLELSLRVFLQAPQMSYPATPPETPPAGTLQSVQVTPGVQGDVQLTKVTIDAAGAVAGDHILEGGEA